MTRYTTLVSAVLIIGLATLHCAEAQRKGNCFNTYSPGKGCRGKDRATGKVTRYQCCKGKSDGGWVGNGQTRDTCHPCVRKTVVNSYWAKWSSWSACNATCGISFESRKRVCVSSGQPNCRGDAIERKKCNVGPCPIDGGWSKWSAWTKCSVTCQKGVRYQKRACNNPTPQYGGKECKGSLEKVQDCEINANCPIDGGWGQWGQWSSCSKTCDIGRKNRNRMCDNPKPQYGGKPCNATEATDIDYCREERCNGGDDDSGDSSSSGWGSGSASGSGESGGESGDEWQGSGSGSGSGSESGSGSGSGFSGSSQ